MKNVTIDPVTGCWLWTGDVARRYGRFWFNGANHRAHRIAYQMAGGTIPDGMLVCHTCDNPLCVRNDDEGTYEVDGIAHPRRGHLWIGTDAVNQRDKAIKGRAIGGLSLHPERAARGERNGHFTHPERTPRGDQSGPRLHPERMARGERHGTHTHPESILRGEGHGSAKITAQIVREIRARYAAGGTTHAQLAVSYGLGKSHVAKIIRREVWAHVE
jgi:hypothetical protein